jgi:hypothetical protein
MLKKSDGLPLRLKINTDLRLAYFCIKAQNLIINLTTFEDPKVSLFFSEKTLSNSLFLINLYP